MPFLDRPALQEGLPDLAALLDRSGFMSRLGHADLASAARAYTRAYI